MDIRTNLQTYKRTDAQTAHQSQRATSGRRAIPGRAIRATRTALRLTRVVPVRLDVRGGVLHRAENARARRCGRARETARNLAVGIALARAVARGRLARCDGR